MPKESHPRDYVDRLYVSRIEGRRVIASIEDNVDISIQRLKDFIEKRGGRLTTAIGKSTNNTSTSGTKITRKLKWEEKQLYGRFKELTSDISHKKVDVDKERRP